MALMVAGEAEEILVERLRAGDKAACAQCVELHSPGVYRLALRLTGDAVEAEDVLQETFLSAFKAIDKFQWRAGLTTWLYRITYNAAMMRLRQPAARVRSVELPVDDGETVIPQQLFDWCCLPEQDFETTEAKAELEHAIHELPETLRAVFLLRELEGLSNDETAATLGLTPENVKTRLYRARLWLRERLAGYFTERAPARKGGR